MVHMPARKLAERVGQHEIRVVEATEETLSGYGRIERDFASAKIGILVSSETLTALVSS